MVTRLLAEIAIGAAGTGAMAVQTAATRLAGYLFPTNVVTGTLTMLCIDTASLLFRSNATKQERGATASRLREHVRVVGGFASGTVVAAVLTRSLHFCAAAVPVIVITAGACHESTAVRPLAGCHNRDRPRDTDAICTSSE